MGKENDRLVERREELARRLAEMREYLGLSQQEVSKATGIPRATISAIETGRRRIESVELETLAQAYEVDVAHFLRAGAHDEPEEIQHIARTAKALASEDRAELLRFAEYLKSHRRTP